MSQYVGNGSVPSSKIAQAQGMVSVQLGCSLDEALARLNAQARTDHETVDQIANAVVARQIRFD